MSKTGLALRIAHLVEAGFSFSKRVVEVVEIDLVSGDSIVTPKIPVGLIKIDVEGLEDQVLFG